MSIRNGFGAFVMGYVECLLWSSTDDDGVPLDRHDPPLGFSAEALAEIAADCRDFYHGHGDAWDCDGVDDSRAGHDFWLTRNGHGAGFWDGDYPISGDRLTAASRPYGECNVYVGDDGLIYLS